MFKRKLIVNHKPFSLFVFDNYIAQIIVKGTNTMDSHLKYANAAKITFNKHTISFTIDSHEQGHYFRNKLP